MFPKRRGAHVHLSFLGRSCQWPSPANQPIIICWQWPPSMFHILQLWTIKVHLFNSERTACGNLLILLDHVGTVKRSWFSIFLDFSSIFLGGQPKFCSKRFYTWSLYALLWACKNWMSTIFLPCLSLYPFQSLHGLLWDTSMAFLFPHNPCCSPAC